MFERIVFLGGKDIGCKILEHLLVMGEPVKGVLTDPDTTNSESWYHSIQNLAYSNSNNPTMYSSNKNDWNFIKSLEPDLIIVAYYDGILPKEIINLPKHGCINIHLADAEKYQGCYPAMHAIMNGDKEFGVTIHKIDEGIDTGDIYVKWNFPIDKDMTGKELYDKATDIGFRMFQYFWDVHKAGMIKAKTQKAGAIYHKRELPSKEVEVRGNDKRKILALDFEPHKPCYVQIGKRRYHLIEDTTAKT